MSSACMSVITASCVRFPGNISSRIFRYKAVTVRKPRVMTAFTVFVLVVTVAGISGAQQSTSSALNVYWNTTHYEVWNHAVLPPTNIPWGSITHLIHFCGGTGGNGTISTYPYYQPQSAIEIDGGVHIGDSLRAIGHRNGVSILLDLGLNWSFLGSWNDSIMAIWAHTIAAYIQNASFNGYDGADMDVEGALAGVQAKIGRAAHILHDTLTALGQRMGKKLYLTCDVLSQFDPLYMAPPPDSLMYFDQCNLMTYDMYGTFGSPLYPEASCGVGECDSSDLQPWISWLNSHYGSAGVAKLGMGYNIQIYQTNKTSACPAGGFDAYSGWNVDNYSAQYFNGGTVSWDNVTKEPYLVNSTHGVLIAYEDTNSTYWKADFIKRKGMGGAMGFCLGRGYIPPQIAVQYNIRDGNGHYVNPHMAAYGMGKGLNGALSPPSQPALSSPANGAVNQSLTPQLIWSPPGIVQTYHVQVSTQATFDSAVVDDSTITSASLQIGPLQSGRIYYWRVSATNTGGTGPYSVIWSFSTLLPPPPPPVLSQPPNGSVDRPTTLTLSWSSSATATSYRVQVATDSSFGSPLVDDSTVTGLSRQVGPLRNITRYFWHVGAMNSGGASGYSGTWSFTTIDTLPVPPVLLSPGWGSVIPRSGSTAMWNAAVYAKSYRIQIAADTSFGNVVEDDSLIGGTLHTIGPFADDTTYYWRVQSKNSIGVSSWSPDRTFQTSLHAITLPFTLIDGWNMVSVPVMISNSSLSSLYPTAISRAFYFSNGYTISDTLVNGAGYWLKFAGSQNMFFNGVHLRSDTVNVQQGWNMIGSIDTEMIPGTDSLISVPPNIIISKLFNYTGSYDITDTVLPGYGYYVRVNQNGKIILSKSSTPGSLKPVSAYPQHTGILVVEDASARRQKLYLGSGIEAERLAPLYELPPLPPEGAFDARFSTNRMFEAVGDNGVQERSIMVSSARYPLRLSWLSPAEGLRVSVLYKDHEESLEGMNPVRLDSSFTHIDLRIRNGPSVPREFTLGQNYPNPFNPATRIDFTLPSAGFVSLKIYDVLGREIAVLVNEDRQPGTYTAEWSAAGAASGVYFYELHSGNFLSARKMLLMK